MWPNITDAVSGRNISHRGIEMGVLTDAPFIGARICALDCHHNCPGCFNQHLRGADYIVEPVGKIIEQIKVSKINEGIILGGLEWTEQPHEMLSLVQEALRYDLKVMIYTHQSIDTFISNFPMLIHYNILVKCGQYEKDNVGYQDIENDVRLASGNQHIFNLRGIKAQRVENLTDHRR